MRHRPSHAPERDRPALRVFLAHGFVGTSVDEVAAEAHASKRTVYGHFGDKEAMFREVVRSTIDPMQAALAGLLEEASGRGCEEGPRTALGALVHGLTHLIVTPDVVQLRRLIAAEADRFPDVAAEWLERGPQETVSRLATYLANLEGIDLDEPGRAAEDLLWLAVSAPLNRLMFLPSGTTPRRHELDDAAEHAIETFWRAYCAPQRTE